MIVLWKSCTSQRDTCSPTLARTRAKWTCSDFYAFRDFNPFFGFCYDLLFSVNILSCGITCLIFIAQVSFVSVTKKKHVKCFYLYVYVCNSRHLEILYSLRFNFDLIDFPSLKKT